MQKIEAFEEKGKAGIEIISVSNFNDFKAMMSLCEKIGYEKVVFPVGKGSMEVFVKDHDTVSTGFRFYLASKGNRYKCAIGARHDLLNLFKR